MVPKTSVQRRPILEVLKRAMEAAARNQSPPPRVDMPIVTPAGRTAVPAMTPYKTGAGSHKASTERSGSGTYVASPGMPAATDPSTGFGAAQCNYSNEVQGAPRKDLAEGKRTPQTACALGAGKVFAVAGRQAGGKEAWSGDARRASGHQYTSRWPACTRPRAGGQGETRTLRSLFPPDYQSRQTAVRWTDHMRFCLATGWQYPGTVMCRRSHGTRAAAGDGVAVPIGTVMCRRSLVL